MGRGRPLILAPECASEELPVAATRT